VAGKQSPFQKGHYYAAKYRGTGGDLILGEVQSVRTSGHIVLTNLLSGKTATKKADVLKCRNKRVSKAQAKKILSAYARGGNEEARKAAIAAPEFRNGRSMPQQLDLNTIDPSKMFKDGQALMDKLDADLRFRIGRFRDDLWKLLRKHGVTK
jgi:hypothetical protein